MKNKMTNNISEHVAAAGTDSNSKFKWSDDLVENLLKAPSNFKTVIEFQNKDFNADKPSIDQTLNVSPTQFFLSLP